jgi:hypothetical protein
VTVVMRPDLGRKQCFRGNIHELALFARSAFDPVELPNEVGIAAWCDAI